MTPSFYTFGKDYHQVLQERIKMAMKDTNLSYKSYVDNHPLDERLIASLGRIGYYGKNQLIISPKHGTYHFLGIILLEEKWDEVLPNSTLDSCGDCRKCIDSCPTGALTENGYIQSRCLSNLNQLKAPLPDFAFEKNYALFGCDICQLVCPKNIHLTPVFHPEFELSGKEQVSINDLFSLSEKAFKDKYAGMAYLWKGKKVLLRNALTLLVKSNNHLYDDDVISLLDKTQPAWFQATLEKAIQERTRKDK